MRVSTIRPPIRVLCGGSRVVCAAASSPLPRPSPSGKGSQRSLRSNVPTIPGLLIDWRQCSLSLRERAGVRGSKTRDLKLLLRCQVVLAGLFSLLAAGCKSLDQPGSASFASVVIQQRTVAEIEATADQVFRENGYTAYQAGPYRSLYEKEGSRANDLAYNGVVGTHYGAKSLVRVKTEVVDLGGGAHRLQCQTYMVRNAGDSFFEEETRLTNFRSGPYQKLLDEIGNRLKQ